MTGSTKGTGYKANLELRKKINTFVFGEKKRSGGREKPQWVKAYWESGSIEDIVDKYFVSQSGSDQGVKTFASWHKSSPEQINKSIESAKKCFGDQTWQMS